MPYEITVEKTAKKQIRKLQPTEQVLIYEIRDEVLIVVVVTVGHRREVYKK